MSFKSTPRISDEGPWIGMGPNMDLGTKADPSELDKLHESAMERAAAIEDPALEKAIGTADTPALYKIEVFYGPGRTLRGPNVAKVSFWESGGRLNGEGDSLMFICRDETGEIGCGTIFSDRLVRGIYASCPGCQKVILADKCTRALIANMTTKTLSGELAKFWRLLNGNADIYCKYDKTDIRYQMFDKKYGPERARQLRGLSIYPLKNIIKDTADGTPIENRIFAFLTA